MTEILDHIEHEEMARLTVLWLSRLEQDDCIKLDDQHTEDINEAASKALGPIEALQTLLEMEG